MCCHQQCNNILSQHYIENSDWKGMNTQREHVSYTFFALCIYHTNKYKWKNRQVCKFCLRPSKITLYLNEASTEYSKHLCNFFKFQSITHNIYLQNIVLCYFLEAILAK